MGEGLKERNLDLCLCTYEVVLLALGVLGLLWSVDGIGDGFGRCDGRARRRCLLYVDNG